MAGVYALRRGAAQPVDMGRAVWFGKPAGTSYAEFYDQLGERNSLWRRQMVLGPTPEFCSMDDDDVPDGAVVVTRVRTVAPPPLDAAGVHGQSAMRKAAHSWGVRSRVTRLPASRTRSLVSRWYRRSTLPSV